MAPGLLGGWDNRESIVMSVHRPPALFLHSAFRSGSTWFWNRFRLASGTCAYYEPFNEALAVLDSAGLANGVPQKWPTGHPRLDAPYFAEYAPLLRPDGGVVHFSPEFSYQRYFDDGPNEAQQRYLGGLIAQARQSDRLPVLGFCRSLVRLPWLRRHCPGVHIATWRNPWDQWASYHHQTLAHKSIYFEFRAFLIACIGRCHGKYGKFFADLHLPPFLQYAAATDEEFLHPFFYASHVDHRFRIFLRVFLIDMLTALAHADAVVDLDRMSGEPAYRQATTVHLQTLSGLADLSFEDCVLPRHAYQDDGSYLAGMDEALAFLEDYGAQLASDTPEARALPELKRRMADCRRELGAAASALADGAEGKIAADQADLDRYALCHVLFAVRHMARPGGNPDDGLAYLRTAYGADYPFLRDDLARMAELVDFLDKDPAHANERLAAGRLSQALASEH